ncbi:MAG: RNA-binding domain-containing protein [Candidatus Caldarchaeum sp.]|jgi:RNA binding exosome subunit
MLKLVKLTCRTHVYSTESIEKVKKAVQNILGETILQSNKTSLTGHFGDSITVLEYVGEDPEQVGLIFRRVVSKVGMGVVGVEERGAGGGKLHIRLDKQKAYLGEVAAEDIDPIKLEFTYVGDWREALKWQSNT